MSDVEPGSGDYEIMLDGQKVILKPSLDTCMQISRSGGAAGFYGAGGIPARVLNCDFDAMVEVIRLGANAGTNPKLLRDIQEKVYKTGLIEVRDLLSIFLGIIANGGRRTEEAPEGEEGATLGEDPQPAGA